MGEGKVGCSEKVHDAFGVGFHPCSRVGRVERDGKWYCSQHDPCYVKKRREQRQVENQQQLKHQRIYSQVDIDAALRRAKAEGVREIRQLRRHLRVALDHAEQHNEGCLYCGEGEIVDGDTTPTHRAKCWYYKAARAAQIEEGV